MFDLTFFEKWTRKMSQRMYPISVSKRAGILNFKRQPATPAQYLSFQLGILGKMFCHTQRVRLITRITFSFSGIAPCTFPWSAACLAHLSWAKQTYCAQTVFLLTTINSLSRVVRVKPFALLLYSCLLNRRLWVGDQAQENQTLYFRQALRSGTIDLDAPFIPRDTGLCHL